jgi:hypothetical protein
LLDFSIANHPQRAGPPTIAEAVTERIAWLVHEAQQRRLTGVALKDASAIAPRLG